MAKDEWFYSKGHERLGPVTAAELRAMGADGRLSPDDLIWREGQADWVPARNARGLFPAQAGPPPPLPQVPATPPPPPPPRAVTRRQDDIEYTELDEEDFYDEPPERVGFGPRVGAALIDGIVSGVAGVVLGLVVAGMAVSEARTAEEEALAAIGGWVLGASLAGIVYGFWEGLAGAAAGKMMLGLIIAKDDGTPAPVGTLLLRYLVKGWGASIFTVLAALTGSKSMDVLGLIYGLVVVIGCFFVLGEARQGFHDMIAHTAVYRKAELEGEAAHPARRGRGANVRATGRTGRGRPGG